MSTQNPNILIIGSSGSGKTTSLRNLNPATTEIINIERKTLPFKSAAKFTITSEPTTVQEIKTAITNARTNLATEVIVLDSFTSLDEIVLQHCRTLYKGFDIYSNHNRMIREFVSSLKIPNKLVVVIAIDEIVDIALVGGNKISKRTCKVEGRELQGTIEKEFTIVLFSEVVKLANGNMDYQFIVNSDGTNSAKAPMGMFATLYVPNDLLYAREKIKEYYAP